MFSHFNHSDEWYLTVAFICLFLMAGDVGHPFLCFPPMHTALLCYVDRFVYEVGLKLSFPFLLGWFSFDY